MNQKRNSFLSSMQRYKKPGNHHDVRILRTELIIMWFGKDSHFSIEMNSNPIICVCGFDDTASISRDFILFVFQRNPRNRLYCTNSAILNESRQTIVPVKLRPSKNPSKSYHSSPAWSCRTGNGTESLIMTVSRATADNSIIVCVWAFETSCKSRFRAFNALINAASSARNLSNSFNESSKDWTRAAERESRTRNVSTSDNNVSVLFLYRSRSPANLWMRRCCIPKMKIDAANIAAINASVFFVITLIVMPHHVLWFCFVIVNVYVRLSDPDTGKPDGQTGLHDFHSVRTGIAPDVNRASVRMRPVSTSATAFIPCRGTIGAIQYKRDPGQFPGRVQPVHRGLSHIL